MNGDVVREDKFLKSLVSYSRFFVVNGIPAVLGILSLEFLLAGKHAPHQPEHVVERNVPECCMSSQFSDVKW